MLIQTLQDHPNRPSARLQEWSGMQATNGLLPMIDTHRAASASKATMLIATALSTALAAMFVAYLWVNWLSPRIIETNLAYAEAASRRSTLLRISQAITEIRRNHDNRSQSDLIASVANSHQIGSDISISPKYACGAYKINFNALVEPTGTQLLIDDPGYCGLRHLDANALARVRIVMLTDGRVMNYEEYGALVLTRSSQPK